jgi:hypothetical protein
MLMLEILIYYYNSNCKLNSPFFNLNLTISLTMFCTSTKPGSYRVSNNNCFSWQYKKLHEIFKTVNCIYVFRFVLLTLLTVGIQFKFQHLGFSNLLLIKWFSGWDMT